MGLAVGGHPPVGRHVTGRGRHPGLRGPAGGRQRRPGFPGRLGGVGPGAPDHRRLQGDDRRRLRPQHRRCGGEVPGRTGAAGHRDIGRGDLGRAPALPRGGGHLGDAQGQATGRGGQRGYEGGSGAQVGFTATSWRERLAAGDRGAVSRTRAQLWADSSSIRASTAATPGRCPLRS